MPLAVAPNKDHQQEKGKKPEPRPLFCLSQMAIAVRRNPASKNLHNYLIYRS
jgi:hypothetical protein